MRNSILIATLSCACLLGISACNKTSDDNNSAPQTDSTQASLSKNTSVQLAELTAIDANGNPVAPSAPAGTEDPMNNANPTQPTPDATNTMPSSPNIVPGTTGNGTPPTPQPLQRSMPQIPQPNQQSQPSAPTDLPDGSGEKAMGGDAGQ